MDTQKKFNSVTPYLIVKDVAQLIHFLEHVFDAKETLRKLRPDGSIQHAQVQLGDSMIMMGESTTDWQTMPGSLYLFLKETDSYYQRALDAGAISIMEPIDQDYGHRSSGVKDPLGNCWWISSEI